MSEKLEGFPVAYYAGGCFWCLESEFRALDGVIFTRSGYMGGTVDHPTYEAITTGKTGHAEAVEVTFDPTKITYQKLTQFFLEKAHDPTQINRQGVDVGTQYRSALFYADDDQKATAQAIVADINARKIYQQPIATQIVPAGTFWEAEAYHQQYYEKYEEKTGAPHIRVLLKQSRKASQK